MSLIFSPNGWRFQLVLFLCLGCSFSNLALSQYCVSGANNSTDSRIDGVVLQGDLLEIRNNTSFTAGTYSDFTNQIADVSRGSSYELRVLLGTFGRQQFEKSFQVFIDWNGDEDFTDPGETIGTGGPFSFGQVPDTSRISFTVPVNAAIGTTRLRIVCREVGLPAAINSCGRYDFGETEDYGLTVNASPGDDVGIVDILLPRTGCSLTNQEAVAVVVRNFGSNPITNIPLGYAISGPVNEVSNELYQGPALGSGQELTFTFSRRSDLSQPGEYQVAAFTSFTQDQVPGNDTSFKTVLANPEGPALPISIDFDGLANNTFNLPPFSNVGDVRWRTNNTFTLTAATGPSNDASGNGSYLYFEASQPALPGDQGSFCTPCVDLTGAQNPEVRFQLHAHGAAIGTFKVEVLTNDTTETLYEIDQEIQQDETDPFVPIRLSLTDYIGESVIICFTAIRGTSFTGDVAIDEIVVTDPQDNDVGITDLLSPQSDCGLTSPSPVEVVITNFGRLSQSVIPLAYQLPGEPIVRDTFLGPLPPDGTATFQFSQPTALLSPATLQVFTELPIDQALGNDSITRTLTDQAFDDYPFEENFDPLGRGDIDFPLLLQNTADDQGDWQVEISGTENTPDTGPLTDVSGSGNYIFLESSSPQAPGDVAKLCLPCLDLSSSANPQLGFFYHMFGSSIGSLRVTVSDGSRIDTIFQLSGGQQQSATDPWRSVNLDLSPFKNQLVDICFEGEVGPGFLGDIALDGISVLDPSERDVRIVAINQPQDGCGDTETPVVVTFCNNSIKALPNIPVRVRIGKKALRKTFKGPLGPGECAEITLGSFDTSDGGIFELIGFTRLNRDPVPENDTIRRFVAFDAVPTITEVISASVVDSGSMLLRVKGSGTKIFWYENELDTQPIASGDTFRTPVLFQSQTYFAETRNGLAGRVGEPVPTFSLGGFISDFSQGLDFRVASSLTLESVKVLPSSTGEVTVRILDNTGTVIQTATRFVSTPNVLTEVTLNVALGPGSYRMDAQGTTVGGLFRNLSGGQFPYTDLNQVLSITENGTPNPLVYYFFYNWVYFQGDACGSPRVPVTATVKQTVQVCEMLPFPPNGRPVFFNAGIGFTYFFVNNSGRFTQFNDGTARLTGRIEDNRNPGFLWDAEVWIKHERTWPEWQALKRDFKGKQIPEAVQNHPDWLFWEVDSTISRFFGVPGGVFEGDTLLVSHNPVNRLFGFQLGQGANDKTGDFGLSGWFFVQSTKGSRHKISGLGDFNVNLDCSNTPLRLEAQALLEGAAQDNGLDMQSASTLPTAQPFGPPLGYAGSERLVSNLGNAIDWVLIELRDSADPRLILHRQAAVLLADGRIVAPDGTYPLSLGFQASQAVFVAIWHRNHLPLMSGIPLKATHSLISFDFTDPAAPLYQDSGIATPAAFLMPNGRRALHQGDVNQDGFINALDEAIILQELLQQGYRPSDISLDGATGPQDLLQLNCKPLLQRHMPK
ncbi:MAG: GEVED domain-containing protein [Bacteroidota bacterium]